MKFTTYYLVLRNIDFEPFIICKDGIGTSALDCEGYQYWYKEYPLERFLRSKEITVIGKWEE